MSAAPLQHVFTYPPIEPGDEDRAQWNHRLNGASPHPRDKIVVTRLKQMWKKHWFQFPDTIKKSFLDYAGIVRETDSNIKSASNHAIWKITLTNNHHDFDWGVWLVLRAIYYDTHKSSKDIAVRQKVLSFEQSQAAKKIKERYPQANIFKDILAPNYPPRPANWAPLPRPGERNKYEKCPQLATTPLSARSSTGTNTTALPSGTGYAVTGNPSSSKSSTTTQSEGDQNHQSVSGNDTTRVHSAAPPRSLSNEDLTFAGSPSSRSASMSRSARIQKRQQSDRDLSITREQKRVKRQALEKTVDQTAQEVKENASQKTDGTLRNTFQRHPGNFRRSFFTDTEEVESFYDFHPKRFRPALKNSSIGAADPRRTPANSSRHQNENSFHSIPQTHLPDEVADTDEDDGAVEDDNTDEGDDTDDDNAAGQEADKDDSTTGVNGDYYKTSLFHLINMRVRRVLEERSSADQHPEQDETGAEMAQANASDAIKKMIEDLRLEVDTNHRIQLQAIKTAQIDFFETMGEAFTTYAASLRDKLPRNCPSTN